MKQYGYAEIIEYLEKKDLINYLETATEYVYLVGNKHGDFLIIRGTIGEIGRAKKFSPDVSWIDSHMQIYTGVYTKDGFIEKDSPKEILTEGVDYIFLTLDDYAKQALDSKERIAVFASELADTGKAAKDMVSIIIKLLEKWGMCSEMVELIAVICVLSGAKKRLGDLEHTYHVVEKIKQNPQDYETLFFKLQEIVGGQYTDDLSGYPTKAIVKKYAKKIAVPFEIFGYGIHYEGLKTIFHCFHNDAVAGVGLDMYQEDTKFDQDDFPYYDGIENDDTAFWDKLRIEDCLK